MDDLRYNQASIDQASQIIKRVLQRIALKSVKKREKQTVEKMMITPVEKRKQAHDDFHKFVRSL